MVSQLDQPNEGVVVVRVLSAVLERLVAVNNNLVKVGPSHVTKFHALKPPSISILHYLERINKYASCSTECFILALIYIDRMIQRNSFHLTDLNVHRVVVTSVLLAAKFFDDAYYNNAYYAKVGGVLVAEMNSLEVEFLFRINFSLHVSPDVFKKYHAELISHAVATPVLAPCLTQSLNFNGVHSTCNYTPSVKLVHTETSKQRNSVSSINNNQKRKGSHQLMFGSQATDAYATQITPSPPPVKHPTTNFSSIPTEYCKPHHNCYDPSQHFHPSVNCHSSRESVSVTIQDPLIYQHEPSTFDPPLVHQHFVDHSDAHHQHFYKPCLIENHYQPDKSCCFRPSSRLHHEFVVGNIPSTVSPNKQSLLYRASSQLRHMDSVDNFF